MSKRRMEKIPDREMRAITRDAHRIAIEVRRKREALGFTQESLAEELGASVETVRGIEIGRRFASLPILLRMCRVLRLELFVRDK